MTDLVPFAYEGRQVRTVAINGETWFVASDVCAVLEIAEPRSSLRFLDEDEKGVHTVPTPGGDQQVSIISEAGLYSLILRSRKPEAKKFKRWVTHELIPEARRRLAGQLQAPSARELAMLVIQEADRADAAESKIAELEPRVEEQRRELLQTRAPMSYLRTYVDPRKDTTTFTVFAKQVGLRTAHQLYDYLIAIDVIWKRVQGRRWSSKGEEIVYQYLPRAGYEHWFKMLDQVDAPPLHNGQQPTTLYVLPPGKVGIGEKLADRPFDTVMPPSNVTKLTARKRRGKKTDPGATTPTGTDDSPGDTA